MKHFATLFSNIGLCIASVVLLSTSCQSPPPLEPPPIKKALSTTLTYDEALTRALEAIAMIEPNSTKVIGRNVKSHKVVGASSTKTENQSSDSLFYIFNFEDNLGFAIIPSDRRAPEALAISNTGNFPIDANDNKTALVIDRLVAYQSMFVPKSDSIELFPDYRDPDTPKTRWEISPAKTIEIAYPMLNVNFNQESPWNSNIDGQYAAGCVTIALAQIMTHFRRPLTHDGFTYNWSEITSLSFGISKNSTSTHRLINDVYCHLPGKSHATGGTSILDRSVVYALDDFGYADDGQEYDYDFNRVVNSILGNSPVYISGDSETFLSIGVDGHAWVLDGYQIFEQTYSLYEDNIGWDGKVIPAPPIQTYTKKLYYVHCNWGWGGDRDGYYVSGIFDAIHNPEILLPTKATGTEGRYYPYNLKIRVNIKP